MRSHGRLAAAEGVGGWTADCRLNHSMGLSRDTKKTLQWKILHVHDWSWNDRIDFSMNGRILMIKKILDLPVFKGSWNFSGESEVRRDDFSHLENCLENCLELNSYPFFLLGNGFHRWLVFFRGPSSWGSYFFFTKRQKRLETFQAHVLICFFGIDVAECCWESLEWMWVDSSRPVRLTGVLAGLSWMVTCYVRRSRLKLAFVLTHLSTEGWPWMCGRWSSWETLLQWHLIAVRLYTRSRLSP